MIKLKKILLICVLPIVLFIIGCAQPKGIKDFNYGLNEVNKLNHDYNTNMETSPESMSQIDLMLNELAKLKNLELESGKGAFNYIIDYRKLNLEADRLYAESQEKYGDAGTTKKGFGCKIRPLIIESASLRNSSALKGFEAVNLLREFIDKYPKEAASANLSQKNALFLNASFYIVWKDANSDSSIINYFCPENVTLDLYKQQFRREKNLSEDLINGLDYKAAVKVWKNSEGIS